MNKNEQRLTAHEVSTDRRSILKLLGAGAVGTAALAVGSDSTSAEQAKPTETGGYRETEHVKTYYDRAGF